MTQEEYKKALVEIEAEAIKKKNSVHKQYALAHNNYNVGDIFTDHSGSVLIEKIEVFLGMSRSVPCCIYFGLELKKDGTPTKKGTKRYAYQCNEVKK